MAFFNFKKGSFSIKRPILFLVVKGLFFFNKRALFRENGSERRSSGDTSVSHIQQHLDTHHSYLVNNLHKSTIYLCYKINIMTGRKYKLLYIATLLSRVKFVVHIWTFKNLCEPRSRRDNLLCRTLVGEGFWVLPKDF